MFCISLNDLLHLFGFQHGFFELFQQTTQVLSELDFAQKLFLGLHLDDSALSLIVLIQHEFLVDLLLELDHLMCDLLEAHIYAGECWHCRHMFAQRYKILALSFLR